MSDENLNGSVPATEAQPQGPIFNVEKTGHRV